MINKPRYPAMKKLTGTDADYEFTHHPQNLCKCCEQVLDLVSKLDAATRALEEIASQQAYAGEVNEQVIGNFYETGIAKQALKLINGDGK